MRGTKAKRIRREVYGEASHRVRHYSIVDGQRINRGLRARYQKAKGR